MPKSARETYQERFKKAREAGLVLQQWQQSKPILLKRALREEGGQGTLDL